ncbi:hypothetical protein THAOC_10675 [Thalassiosira oceanica]|uniref:Uncharacterized protein n=1 Tax=Thalassiosira oceanica TaxID=159749 RepID=K0ST88_THAOC|nr:hypothetical protein THAOC_10675 [Thalassiosira oceanica]|eukprot:EJK68169.1 hypothetical protein THAOC_10675 [Thalassiosira oceanica]
MAILIVKRVTERQRSAHGDITGFEIRRFSNGDLHAADSQVNSKYVQMDVGTLTDGLSLDIHRSTAIASIIRFACFRLLRIIRFSIAWYHKHYCAKAYWTPANGQAICEAKPDLL